MFTRLKNLTTASIMTLDENGDSFIPIMTHYSKNWGDKLNPVLVKHISGKIPLIVNKNVNNKKRSNVYSVIGSVLQDATENNCPGGSLSIWGTGLISKESRLNVKPKEICAVRGPLTRDILLKQGFDCPEIYGDPALLYPKYYNPDKVKKYRLGVIPHYVDNKHGFIQKIKNETDIIIIDIKKGIDDVVDQICSCDRIASSSLHGLIASDAYGIKSTWIKMTDNIIGNDFKFVDYYGSVGKEIKEPYNIDEMTTIDDLKGLEYHSNNDIDLNELYEACPFLPT